MSREKVNDESTLAGESRSSVFFFSTGLPRRNHSTESNNRPSLVEMRCMYAYPIHRLYAAFHCVSVSFFLSFRFLFPCLDISAALRETARERRFVEERLHCSLLFIVCYKRKCILFLNVREIKTLKNEKKIRFVFFFIGQFKKISERCWLVC